MAVVPTKVADRLASGLKRFQPIIGSARARDVNEADTVVIIMDVLSELFGYDKYSEVTREHCIRGTYCDLAIKVDGKVEILIEVKAIGLDLKENHIKQAVDYAANQGVEWVILTNGMIWRVYHVIFSKPIEAQQVLELDILSLSQRNSAHIESLYLLTKESVTKSALKGYRDQQQVTSRFYLATIILSDPCLDIIRRELRRMHPDVKIQNEEIRARLISEVLKRDTTEGPEADQARKKLQKTTSKILRARRPKDDKATGEGLEPTEAGDSEVMEESELEPVETQELVSTEQDNG